MNQLKMKYMNEQIKNTGLIIEEIDEQDWKFGSSGLGLTKLGDIDKNKYLPTGEVQRRNDIDKMACVTFSAMNHIEMEMNYRIDQKEISVGNLKWLEDNGYLDNYGKLDLSDRYIAKLSNTSSSGNSLQNLNYHIENQ